MTERERMMMEMVGLSEEDFEPVDKDTLIEEAYLKAEYNSIMIELIMEDNL